MMDERPLEGRRILVVENEYFLARDFCEWLQEAGADVVGPAPDREQVRDLLSSRAVDSAIVDINLGEGPSYDVARQLTGAGVPFLFATGYDKKAIPEEFSGYPRLEKPFKPHDLVRAVASLG